MFNFEVAGQVFIAILVLFSVIGFWVWSVIKITQRVDDMIKDSFPDFDRDYREGASVLIAVFITLAFPLAVLFGFLAS